MNAAMNAAVRYGLLLGGLLAIQILLFATLGWHEVYAMQAVFLVVAMGLNATAVVLCLRRTAPERTWSGQLAVGLVLGAVAAAIATATNWLVTNVLHPDYFAAMAAGYRPTLEQMDLPAETVRALLAGIEGTTPIRAAVEVIVGTIGTSLLVSAIAAVKLRRRSGSPIGPPVDGGPR